MQIVALPTLWQFWDRHPDAEGPIRALYAKAAKARWIRPADVKREFGTTAIS